MGSAERRKREIAETRQRILDAARDLFVENGFEATSMRAIARRIEYTPTAIYHHFENKDALLGELCNQDFRFLARAFQRIGRVEDPIERLDRIGEAYVEFALEHPKHYEFMFMTVRPPAGEQEIHGDPGEDAYAFLREAVADAMEQGRFLPEHDDPDQIAQMLWGSLHGLISLRLAKGHDPWVEFRDIRETARVARWALMRGLMG